MRTNPTALAVLALFAIAAALTAAALAGKSSPTPSEPPAPTPDRQQQERDVTASKESSRDPAVDIARRYALAARNWTSTTYRASWEVQIRLAGGRYRRELVATRPDAAHLAALKRDQAASRASVVRAQRDPALRPPVARVFVVLDETTVAGSQTIRGHTLNEVRLSSRRGRWRVTGWTVIPGGQAQ
jgi:hypothetical protein